MAAPQTARRVQRYDTASLLAVAVRVFTERGYDGTSMEDLARAAGVSKSSIYHHVDGKEHLLHLALERALDPLFAVLEEPAATQGPALARLEHVLRREVEVLVAELPYVTLLLRVRGNTETERWALQRRRDFDAAVAALAARAAQEGDLRADLDPALVTRLVFGMINSVVEWYRPKSARGGGAGSRAETDGLADAVLALALDGLRAR
ncbi:AcrR family transcriptional regulator [Kineococcus xinjiangensis]|uniref:AcrR family transcriptional regulator n=1 Tax=Kineococcus xinjiangensis TaxID=512762 RepID=A0A2S6IK82_9ACTN|nr:TetR/AcrR family transcriptional regulator [Kineococcus xinjiangensis]PPK94586.1 AcrR family transcriptional regulator [Kineococcus xinjiangensis]